MSSQRNGVLEVLQEFSIPLLAGVALALLAANLAPDWYHEVVEGRPFGDVAIFGHPLTVHFLVNDVFMVFFFGIAAKEITESCLPGGALNPPSKAVNPLLAIEPPCIIVRVSHASVSPPTASTAPAHVAFSSGLVPISNVPRTSSFDAPSERR